MVAPPSVPRCESCGYFHAPDYSDVRDTLQEWIEGICLGAKAEVRREEQAASVKPAVLVTERPPMGAGLGGGIITHGIRPLPPPRGPRLPQEMPPVLHVKFKRVHGHAGSLAQAYRGDAGYDLELCEEATLWAGQWTNLRTGIVAAIPDGYWGHILARSSTWRHLGIRVEPAIIDSSYRGELMIYAIYTGPDKFVHVSVGQRLAQIVIIPVPNVEWLEQRDLPPGERGERGYGSSGKG